VTTDQHHGEGRSSSSETEASEESLELDETWAEARREAGLDPDEIGVVEQKQPGLVSPYLVLYAGFFLGPGAAFLSSLAVAPRRLTVRRVSVMLGICGACWCAIQGATGALADGWGNLGLQMMRSGLNFVGSGLLLLFWRREFPSGFLHDRMSIARSFGIGTVLLIAFVWLPPDVLAYIGR
jgi:hypothetical protein